MTPSVGKEFNEKYKDIKLVQLIKQVNDRYGQRNEKVNPKSDWRKPIYNYGIQIHTESVYDLNKLYKFIDYKAKHYIKYVSVPEDAVIFIERDHFRVEKLVVIDKVKLRDIPLWEDKDFCINALYSDTAALKYIKDPSYEMYMIALNGDGLLLRYLKCHPDIDKLALIAVKQNGLAFQYVENQTDEICLAAVKQNGLALRYVKTKTNAICTDAIRQTGLALEYVQNHELQNGTGLTASETNEIIDIAIQKHRDALKFVKIQTDKLCLKAVKHYGEALKHVINQTDEICLAAVKHHGIALRYVKTQTYPICLAAAKHGNYGLWYVKESKNVINHINDEFKKDVIHQLNLIRFCKL
jgi:hypothetical protein